MQREPVGFLSLRLERAGEGIRASVTWNTDVDDRSGDRTRHSIDLDAAVRQVHEFIDQYAAGLRRS